MKKLNELTKQMIKKEMDRRLDSLVKTHKVYENYTQTWLSIEMAKNGIRMNKKGEIIIC